MPAMSRIRLARPADAHAILAIYAPIVRETAISFEYNVPDTAEIEARIRKVLTRYPWLVYEEHERVLGYAYASAFRERAAYQWTAEASIYVHPAGHGRGIGRKLYATLFDVLRAQGFAQVVAGATVPNESSERLHLGLGFRQVAHFPAVGYKFGRWHDTVFWSLPLRPPGEPARDVININDLIETAEWSWLRSE